MSSVEQVRHALAVASEATDRARGHTSFAHTRLDEVARLYAGLADSAADLPRGDIDRARRDVEDLLATIHAASDALADLDARL